RRGRRQRCRANGRQHCHPGTPLCRRRKGGTQNQALGRSRGGFPPKTHARTNAEGLPVALLLTQGETHDSTAFTDLMAEHDADPEVMLADKGYDSDAIREEVRARGGTPEIPTKKNRHAARTKEYPPARARSPRPRCRPAPLPPPGPTPVPSPHRSFRRSSAPAASSPSRSTAVAAPPRSRSD